jgi:hypothetical protein
MIHKIVSKISKSKEQKTQRVTKAVEEFAKIFDPIEDSLYVLMDARTYAVYCECHVDAEKLLQLSTIDVPLDPDEQPEYRANREIMEDHVAFEQMKSDAKQQRTFSNIVAEFDTSNNPDYPLKIIGGQHRYIAIQEAYKEGIAEHHGLKVYFDLDKDQRLDVQLISNVNIAVSTDLYDRLQETSRGPELREWCQEVGFLDPGQDFSAKRQRGSPITVRAVRSFILNYYLGKEIDPRKFSDVDTTAVICKTGKPDPNWDELRDNEEGIWDDADLKEAAKEFIRLDEAQRAAIERSESAPTYYAEKALNFSIMTAWAYVAGILQPNEKRLERHYNLRRAKGKDPLNAGAMAKGRHKSDPENYRGLGTRSNPKERGRCVELFYLQAEKDSGITPSVVDVAIKRYHKKQVEIELREAERKL